MWRPSPLVREAGVDRHRDAGDVAAVVGDQPEDGVEMSTGSTMSTGSALAIAWPMAGSDSRNCCITSLTTMGVRTPVGCTEFTRMLCGARVLA